MAQLPWFNHDGESVLEILGLKARFRTDSLVAALEMAVQQKLEVVDESALNEYERTVLVVEALEREVNNGGFRLFFTNTPEYAPQIVEALHRIDCHKMAAIAHDALVAAGVDARSPDALKAAMAHMDPSRLGECDSRFMEYPENIAERLFEFVERSVKAR